jgi:hypothetical protein
MRTLKGALGAEKTGKERKVQTTPGKGKETRNKRETRRNENKCSVR